MEGSLSREEKRSRFPASDYCYKTPRPRSAKEGGGFTSLPYDHAAVRQIRTEFLGYCTTCHKKTPAAANFAAVGGGARRDARARIRVHRTRVRTCVRRQFSPSRCSTPLR